MISDQMFVALMALLKFGLLLFIGFRELWILRRLREERDGDPPHEPRPVPPLPDAGPAQPVLVGKLPDGLVPKPAPARARELEPA